MKKEYKIEGSMDDDITEECIDRILDDLYIWNGNLKFGN